MARYSSVTDPSAIVTVTATITQKMREDLRLLSFAKEHLTLKSLVARLIQNYLDENVANLEELAKWRVDPSIPTDEVLATH